MEQKTIRPLQHLDARVTAPPSKAHTMRALFMAALAHGESEIVDPLKADDQRVATQALRQMGVRIEWHRDRFVVAGNGGRLVLPDGPLDMGMSGVAMHFLISLTALAGPGVVRIDGAERMRVGRPVSKLLESLAMLGVEARSLSPNGCLPVDVRADGLPGGRAVVDGSIHSQYISSLLVAAPLAASAVTLETDGRVVSKPYIDITIDCMARFGVQAENRDYRVFTVPSGQRYQGIRYQVEGDFSNASYFLGAAAITGGRVVVDNLEPATRQGDRVFAEILKRMGCSLAWRGHSMELRGGELHAVAEDLTDCPDLVPGLAVTASFARGTTVFGGVKGLRYKECDRLAAVVAELRKMGVEVEDGEDEIRIRGTDRHRPAEIDTYNDHRMAMSFAMAGLKVPGTVIRNPQVVSKSFPDFFAKWEGLYR